MAAPRDDARYSEHWRAGGLDRLASFRFTYVALLIFVLLYVFSVKGLEAMLEEQFAMRLAAAVQGPGDGRPPGGNGSHGSAPTEPFSARLDAAVADSWWVHPGGVRVAAMVFSGDVKTPLYIRGDRVRFSVRNDPGPNRRAIGEVLVSIPHNSLAANAILIVYAATLVQSLFWFSRWRARLEEKQLRDALADRERAAGRAAEIESRLAALTEREAQLRSETGQLTRSLEEERDTLEDLLEEVVTDLGAKDRAIRDLEHELERASRRTRGPRRRGDAAGLRRRLETLYPSVQIDERAADDLADLEEEPLLRAEQAIKRLVDDGGAPVRRKLGGLPGRRAVFELGFSGKRRLYFSAGGPRRYRVLRVGAKNSQQADLEYLSRVKLGE